MKLQPDETDIMGRWIEIPGGVRPDDTCRRIDWLLKEVLEEVAVSPEWGAWEVLFRDPSDGRYWERTFPEGDMHGGGPPRLRCISFDEAREKYPI
jgi:hypothetical protein